MTNFKALVYPPFFKKIFTKEENRDALEHLIKCITGEELKVEEVTVDNSEYNRIHNIVTLNCICVDSQGDRIFIQINDNCYAR